MILRECSQYKQQIIFVVLFCLLGMQTRVHITFCDPEQLYKT